MNGFEKSTQEAHLSIIKRRGSRYGQRGAGMVEVMMALVLSTMGILGFLQIQQQSLNATHQAIWRQSADRLSRNLIAMMQSNALAASDYGSLLKKSEDGKSKSAMCQGAGACTPAQIAQHDVDGLKAQLRENFPNGKMAVLPCAQSRNSYCVVVSWFGVAPADCLEGAAYQLRCFVSAPLSGLLSGFI